MPRRKLLTGFLLTAGSLAGTVLYRRRVARRRERVDLYFVDGTIISVAEGSRGSDRLLQHARNALGATRP